MDSIKEAAGHNLGGYRFDSGRQKSMFLGCYLAPQLPIIAIIPALYFAAEKKTQNTRRVPVQPQQLCGYEEANAGKIIKATGGIVTSVLASSARAKLCRQVLSLLCVSRHQPWGRAQRWSDTEISVKDGSYVIAKGTLRGDKVETGRGDGSPKT